MVKRERKSWGVRLTSQPLSGMRIIGEINYPKGTRTPESKFWFDGVTEPLGITELMVWQQALLRFIDEAKGVSAEMRKKK